jgi:hypothetical protein
MHNSCLVDAETYALQVVASGGCIHKMQPNGHVLNSDWIAGLFAGGDVADGCQCDMGGSCCDPTNASNGGATAFDGHGLQRLVSTMRPNS